MRAVETYLGGRVRARQPEAGYRASVDSVLLGAAVSVARGGDALELGSGSGAALLIAAARNESAAFIGIEKDETLCALARANVALNGACERVSVRCGDIAKMPEAFDSAFDAVFFNPPFYDDPDSIRAPIDPARRTAFVNSDNLRLADWLRAALGALRDGGRLFMIHRAECVPDLLCALAGAAGDVRLRPIATKQGAPARRVLAHARKGARSPFRLLAPLALHHENGEASQAAQAILSGACAFSWDA